MLDLYINIGGMSRNKLPAQPVVDLYAKLIAFGMKAAKVFKSGKWPGFALSSDENSMGQLITQTTGTRC